MPWSTTSSHVVTPLVYSCCSTYSSKLYLYSSWNAYILRLSEIRPVPWFLTEEAEVLVDPSTWSNLNKVEPGTNDRDYLSSWVVLQSYVRILLLYNALLVMISMSRNWISAASSSHEECSYSYYTTTRKMFFLKYYPSLHQVLSC